MTQHDVTAVLLDALKALMNASKRLAMAAHDADNSMTQSRAQQALADVQRAINSTRAAYVASLHKK